jgi:hypothetical protein
MADIKTKTDMETMAQVMEVDMVLAMEMDMVKLTAVDLVLDIIACMVADMED